jgi:Na+/proline symporter
MEGGLRSTILADYLHTFIIFVILFVLAFVTYTTSDLIGSPSKMYNLLTEAAISNPSPNYANSWVTMKSIGAIKFGEF